VGKGRRRGVQLNSLFDLISFAMNYNLLDSQRESLNSEFTYLRYTKNEPSGFAIFLNYNRKTENIDRANINSRRNVRYE